MHRDSIITGKATIPNEGNLQFTNFIYLLFLLSNGDEFRQRDDPYIFTFKWTVFEVVFLIGADGQNKKTSPELPS